MGEPKKESNPHIGAIKSEEKYLRLSAKQQICGIPKWNENKIVLAAAIHTPRQCSGWELESKLQLLWSNPQMRAAVDCRN